ncbi:hypothetical protein LVJ82_05420 [Vitreoscilla massiliensis]|uniref:Uncharacterized protein n=1 Tax=Vitreoscilla massiliensis TaxID=1689272 RepID=A0ABY4E519_9NEIS|nr:hypothetical protein [Vitreoscilla massiliensis]UOO90418.1 hypothetical protein LVJ82_05420 [Vitreoscilla massiliensis]
MKTVLMCVLLAVAAPSFAKMDEAMLCQMLGELAESSLQKREQGVDQDGAMQAVYQQTERIEQPFVRGLVNGLMAEVVNDAYRQDTTIGSGDVNSDNFNERTMAQPTLAAVVQQRCQKSGIGAFLR